MICRECKTNKTGILLIKDTGMVCHSCIKDLHIEYLYRKMITSYNSLKYYATPTKRDIFEKWLDGLDQWKISSLNAILVSAAAVFFICVGFMAFSFAGYVANLIKFGF